MAIPDGLGAYPPLIQRLLALRGIQTDEQARRFMDPAPAPRPDPRLLPDMEQATTRLHAAIRSGDQIAIYGDYDVDGLSATAILSDGLRDLGANVSAFIPNRYTDGYGLATATLARMHAEGVRVVVTVDCGITAEAELNSAASMGMDTIVVDHHEVLGELPRAVAAIDPKRADSAYPSDDLCSAALALRLLEVLYATSGQQLDLDRYLDLAALATVCDMVPLIGENRELVKAGLYALANTSRPGLKAILQSSGASGPPDADTLAFRVGPRLNAAGRLGDANVALEALLTTDVSRAMELATQLNDVNRRRQQMVEDATIVARELSERQLPDAPALVVGCAEISRGIVGLIATRLVEAYGRPAFVYEQGPEQCVGSARGLPGFDVTAALSAAAGHLTRYGGHRAAGGFSLPISNLKAFRNCIQQSAILQLADMATSPAMEIDAEEPLANLAGPVLRYLAAFAPSGVGNPAPVLLSRDVSVTDRRLVGNGRHLQLRLRDRRTTWRAIAFGWEGPVPGLGASVDIVYCVDAGRAGVEPQLRVKALELSTTREMEK